MAGSSVRNVFVYGSLLAPEVLTTLLKRIPASSPAVLHDFHRHSITGHIYPAAVPAKGSKIAGKVLFELTDKELNALDDFEGVAYRKTTVEPILLDSEGLGGSVAAKLEANIYVWVNSQDDALYGDWDYEKWREEYLSEFLKMYF